MNPRTIDCPAVPASRCPFSAPAPARSAAAATPSSNAGAGPKAKKPPAPSTTASTAPASIRPAVLLLQRPTVASIVAGGARDDTQLLQNLGALGWPSTTDEIATLDAASRRGPVVPYRHPMDDDLNPTPTRWRAVAAGDPKSLGTRTVPGMPVAVPAADAARRVAATGDFEPQCVLLLYGDAGDPVARALLQGAARLGWPLVALSAQQLLDHVAPGDVWTVAGRTFAPRRTALINRLPLADRLEPGDATAAATVARQAVWTRLRDALGGFGYASSLPTATSIMGCHGSLLDQWQDLPRLVPGLRVPDHSAPSLPRRLHGTVHAVDRWTPYSLGKPLDQALAAGLPSTARLDFVLPEGRLVHLAQIGEALFIPNPPPTMTAAQQQAMVDVARAFAAVSPLRILEHAFFLGAGAPVLYSSFPVPVLSGGHPLYPELVRQGLSNDIRQWGRRRPA